MSHLLYCILAAPAEISTVPTLKGVGGRPVALVRAAGLAAAVSQLDRVDRGVESVMAYGEVVEHCHRHCTVVPMRYGCLLDGERAVQAHLEACQAAYQALLAELDGCVEMGARIVLEQEPSTKMAAESGRDYLRARRCAFATTEHGEREAAALDEALHGLYRRRLAEPGHFAGHAVHSVHYLVETTRLGPFRTALRGLRPGGGSRLLTSGPWPPYSFATPAESLSAHR